MELQLLKKKKYAFSHWFEEIPVVEGKMIPLLVKMLIILAFVECRTFTIIYQYDFCNKLHIMSWMILFKKQLFDLEVKGQGPTKVIMVRDTLPYGLAPTYQISLTIHAPCACVLLSKVCPDHNFFVFPDRSIIFGMWVHDHKAVCHVP
jgi:hypothetical protein